MRKKRILNCSDWAGFADIYNKIFDLSDMENMADLVNDEILPSLPRMLWQQLPWQINHPSSSYLYRSWYIQNFPQANEYHFEQHNINLVDFCLASFCYYAQFLKSSKLIGGINLEFVGISHERRDAFLKVTSASQNQIREHIEISQRRNKLISFGRSFLRDFPILKSKGKNQELYSAPMKELIMSRATTDLLLGIPKDGGIGHEVGKRFESYVVELTNYALTPVFDTFPDYEVRKGMRSSDVLVVDKNKELKLIIECKSHYLGMEIRNSPDPWHFHEGRHNPLVAGVVQIWRYCQSLLNIENARFSLNSEHTKGIILTLHPWLILATEVQGLILSKAQEKAKIEDIDTAAMIPISFITMDDWERTIFKQTPHGVIELVSKHCEEEFRGYMFGGEIPDQKEGQSLRTIKKTYPYIEKLPDVMPWWAEIQK